MDEEDTWWFLSWFDYEEPLAARTEKTDKDWIGWGFFALGILLMIISIIMVIYSIVDYK